jgi:hypothetical protein
MNRSGGPPVFLAYRQRLANLELSDLTGLVSCQLIDPTATASVFEDETDSSVEDRLRAQATIGQVVPSLPGRRGVLSHYGQSTHSL